MNALENYIVEVHEVKPFTGDWTKEEWAKDKEWVEVEHTTNCYGSKKRGKRIYTTADWETTLQQGFYWG